MTGVMLQIALFNAAAATLLAVVVYFVSRFVKRPALAHALWLLVLLRLVAPPLIEVPVAIDLGWTAPVWPEGSQPAAIREPSHRKSALQASEPIASPRLRSPLANPDAPGEPRPIFEESASRGQARPAASAPAATSLENGRRRHTTRGHAVWTPRSLAGAVIAIWLTGTVLWFAIQTVRIARFNWALRDARPASHQLRRRAERLARRMGLLRCPDVVLVAGRVSPMLWTGAGRARLVLPAELLARLDGCSVDALLAHELAHYRRGDHWVRLLELLVVGVYWWHPVAWWARRAIEAAEEECCDAWAISLFPLTPRSYADVFLDTLDFLSETRPLLPPAASGIGQAASLRRRLTAMMHTAPPKTISHSGRLAILLAAAALPLYPALVDDQQAAEARSSALHEASPARSALAEHADRAEQADRPSESLPDPGAPGSRPVGGTASLVSPGEDIGAKDGLDHVWATAFSPDGRQLIQAKAGGRVFLHQVETGQVLDLTRFNVTTVAFSPDGRSFVSGSADGTVHRWNSATGQLVGVIGSHDDLVRSVAYASDGRMLASGSRDGAVRLWDAESQNELAELRQDASVTSICFSADDRTLAIATGDWKSTEPGHVTLWDISSPQPRITLDCGSAVGAACFLPDRQTIATAQWSGRVTLWDTRTGLEAGSQLIEKDHVSAAAFSHDSLVLSRLAPPDANLPESNDG